MTRLFSARAPALNAALILAAATVAPACSQDETNLRSMPSALCEPGATNTVGWRNQPVEAQSGVFELTFSAIAGANNMDSLTGLSSGAAQTWDDLAVVVRFNAAGKL